MKKKTKNEYVDPILYEMGILKEGEGLGRFLENGTIHIISDNLPKSKSVKKSNKK